MEDSLKSLNQEDRAAASLLISGQTKAIENRRTRKNTHRVINFTKSVPTMNQVLASPLSKQLNLDLHDALPSKASSKDIIGERNFDIGRKYSSKQTNEMLKPGASDDPLRQSLSSSFSHMTPLQSVALKNKTINPDNSGQYLSTIPPAKVVDQVPLQNLAANKQ